MQTSKLLLNVSNLTYTRGYHKLFTNLSFSLNYGDILRINGENGKGKTSLLKNISGLTTPDSGNIRLLNISNKNSNYYKNCIYLGHNSTISMELNALDNLLFLINLKQSCSIKQAKSALDKIGLKYYYYELASHMSAGQRRRILLASLFLLKSPLWLLDEPFTALDKEGIELVENLILTNSKNNGACIFTTHQNSVLNNNKNLIL